MGPIKGCESGGKTQLPSYVSSRSENNPTQTFTSQNLGIGATRSKISPILLIIHQRIFSFLHSTLFLMKGLLYCIHISIPQANIKRKNLKLLELNYSLFHILRNINLKIDIYQGNNINKIDISEEILDLPTNKQTLVNAILSAGFDNYLE